MNRQQILEEIFKDISTENLRIMLDRKFPAAVAVEWIKCYIGNNKHIFGVKNELTYSRTSQGNWSILSPVE